MVEEQRIDGRYTSPVIFKDNAERKITILFQKKKKKKDYYKGTVKKASVEYFCILRIEDTSLYTNQKREYVNYISKQL